MLLVAGPHFDVLKFVQILSWILLPALATALLTTIYWHYRKKKEAKVPAAEEDILPSFTRSFTGQIGYTDGKGEYVSFDHSDLMHQFKKELSYSHARYTALQHDFTVMDTKYSALAKYARTHFITFKKTPMEKKNEELPQRLQADIEKLAENDAMEKNSLQIKLLHLEKSFQRLEDENKTLRDQVRLETATDTERAAIINKWREENTLLKDRIDNQEYLQELVDEKKAQLNFLQNQLEQRIKNLYQSEHQRLKAVAELKEMKELKDAMQTDLLLKQEQIDKAQVVLCAKEEQFAEGQRILTEKTDYVVQLEALLRESKEQVENSHLSLSESRQLINNLQQELADAQVKAHSLGQRLSANRQMIRKVYKELSDFARDGGDELLSAQPGKLVEEMAIK